MKDWLLEFGVTGVIRKRRGIRTLVLFPLIRFGLKPSKGLKRKDVTNWRILAFP